MILNIDVDGVLRNIHPKICDVYEKLYKIKINPDDIENYNMDVHFPLIKDHKTFFVENAKEIFYEAKPFEGIELINELYKKHKINIVTSQFYGIEHYTLDWLRKHKVKYHEIHFSFEKHYIHGDILLDDKTSHLKKCPKKTKPICMSQKHNLEWKGKRVNNLKEFYELVNELENKRTKFNRFIKIFKNK